MDLRNGKRSPVRGNGRRSSERHGRRYRSRSRTPIQRRRSSRYSPPGRRSRSRSLTPYRTRQSQGTDSYHHNQRSSSSESRRKATGDVRRPTFKGAEDEKVLEQAERDKTRIIVYRKIAKENNYDSKFTDKRVTVRDRSRAVADSVYSKGSRRAENDRRLVYSRHSRWDEPRRGSRYVESKCGSRKAYGRSSRDRSPSPTSRPYDSRRNPDVKNGREYDYDRNPRYDYYDKLERSRKTQSKYRPRSERQFSDEELRTDSSHRRSSKERHSYEKYQGKNNSTYKNSKNSRHNGDEYSMKKDPVAENNEGKTSDESEESYENEEGEQGPANGEILPSGGFYPPWPYRRLPPPFGPPMMRYPPVLPYPCRFPPPTVAIGMPPRVLFPRYVRPGPPTQIFHPFPRPPFPVMP